MSGGRPGTRTQADDETLGRFAAGETAGFRLYQANLLWQRNLAQALSPIGITHAQFAVLVATWYLGRDGILPRQGEISDYAQISAAMTSNVVTLLLERGWVVRGADQTDGRASRLQVTEGGLAVARRAAEVMDRAEDAFFQSGPDHDALVRGLKALAGRKAR
jgi:DNA-binding MarR family transcriptional regulator